MGIIRNNHDPEAAVDLVESFQATNEDGERPEFENCATAAPPNHQQPHNRARSGLGPARRRGKTRNILELPL